MKEELIITTSSEQEVPWADFFNTIAYFNVHRRKAKAFYFSLKEKGSDKVLFVAHFTEKEPGFFCSPLRGTYGGVDAAENSAERLAFFLEGIENALTKEGAKCMRMALAPAAHDVKRSTLIQNALEQRGWKVVLEDIDYYLDVDHTPLIEKMERNNKKRVRKCNREGCNFVKFDSKEDYKKVYDVICTNREYKSYPVTMTFEQIMEMKEQFPNRWLFFGVEKDDALIAASVCICINPHILYVFYWGDLPEARTLSPIAFLANHLYSFCQQESITFLDIGIATEEGKPNEGLMTFKENLGCKSTPKRTYEKIVPEDKIA